MNEIATVDFAVPTQALRLATWQEKQDRDVLGLRSNTALRLVKDEGGE